MKYFKTLLLLGAILAPAIAFAATATTPEVDFSAAENMAQAATKSAQVGVGGFVYTVFGLLPFIVMLGLAYLGYSQSSKENKQEQGKGMAVAAWTAGGAIGGYIAGIVIISMLGTGLFQSAKAGWNLHTNYLKSSVAKSGGEGAEKAFEDVK